MNRDTNKEASEHGRHQQSEDDISSATILTLLFALTVRYEWSACELEGRKKVTPLHTPTAAQGKGGSGANSLSHAKSSVSGNSTGTGNTGNLSAVGDNNTDGSSGVNVAWGLMPYEFINARAFPLRKVLREAERRSDTMPNVFQTLLSKVNRVSFG